MANPNPVINKNMNIGSAPKPGPTTEIGKFRASLNSWKGKDKIPQEVRELYEFYIGRKTKELNQIQELKNLSSVIKTNVVGTIFDKMISGEKLGKRDIEMLKLFKDTNVESHKLEFGDRKVIHNEITYKDVRKQIFDTTGKKIINAKVMEDGIVSQDMDRSGRGEGTGTEDKEDTGDNRSSDSS